MDGSPRDLAAGPAQADHAALLHRLPSYLVLPPDATLLLDADGLVERRGEGLDEGLERLRCAAEAGPRHVPEPLVDVP